MATCLSMLYQLPTPAARNPHCDSPLPHPRQSWCHRGLIWLSSCVGRLAGGGAGTFCTSARFRLAFVCVWNRNWSLRLCLGFDLGSFDPDSFDPDSASDRDSDQAAVFAPSSQGTALNAATATESANHRD